MHAAHAFWVSYLGGRGIKGRLFVHEWLLLLLLLLALLTRLWRVLVMVWLMPARCAGAPCIWVVERHPLHVIFV
jgi:hypothetical protein